MRRVQLPRGRGGLEPGAVEAIEERRARLPRGPGAEDPVELRAPHVKRRVARVRDGAARTEVSDDRGSRDGHAPSIPHSCAFGGSVAALRVMKHSRPVLGALFIGLCLLVSGILLREGPAVAQVIGPGLVRAVNVVAASAAPSADPTPPPKPAPPREPEGLAHLADYVFEGMIAWKKPGKDAVAYADVARDIAWESLNADPLPSLRGATCARGTVLVATLAYFEGGFLAYVDDGRVNNGKWREQAFKNGITWSPKISDDGEAFSLWQIHPEKGIVLTPNGEWTWNEGAATDAQGLRKPGVVTGPDLTKTRRLAVRVAIAFLRKSIRLTHGLVGYTGETAATGFGKASARELFAASWCKRHPFGVQ